MKHLSHLKCTCRGLILLLVSSVGCQTNPPAPQDLAASIHAKMQSLAESGDFGGSLGVIYQGQVILQEGYGWADFEKKIPCTKETNYRIGSVTKQFTAAGLLLLSDQGRLSPQDTVDKWVPEYARGSEVTLHQLATNSSGLPNTYPTMEEKAEMEKPIGPLEFVERYENTPFLFEPGTSYEYSNYGFSLLGLALSRASGLSYESFVEELLFQPNGMDRNSFDGAPDLAKGYVVTGDFTPERHHYTWAYAAGAAETNVVDMGLWLDALAAGKVLSPDALKKLITPVHGDYAYGWGSRPLKVGDRTVTLLTHSGGYPGYVNQALLIPELRLSVVAFSNQTEVSGELLEEIMEMVLRLPQVTRANSTT